MIRNRTIELTSYVTNGSIGSKLRDSPSLSDQLTEAPEDPKYAKARQAIRKLKSDSAALQNIKKDYFKATKPEAIKKLRGQINDRFTSGNKLLQELKLMISQINNEFKKQSEEGDKSRLVECHRITQQANEAVTAFRDAEESISQEMKGQIQRQANIMEGREITQDELDQIMAKPERSQQMLRQKLLDVPSVQLENYVSDIIDKCNDVVKLERSMRQCLSLMEELALLVQLQGEKLTSIEEAIGVAKDHLDKGEVKLQSGKQLHKKSKKKMCCIMMILLAIIGVIVIPIVLTQL